MLSLQYLDNNIYKKCYYTCKECELGGNNITHNCLTCKDNYTFVLNNNTYYNNCYIDKIKESIQLTLIESEKETIINWIK